MHELFIWYLGESCVEKLRLLLLCFALQQAMLPSQRLNGNGSAHTVCVCGLKIQSRPQGRKEGKKPVDVFLAELVTRMNGLTRFPLSLSTL